MIPSPLIPTAAPAAADLVRVGRVRTDPGGDGSRSFAHALQAHARTAGGTGAADRVRSSRDRHEARPTPDDAMATRARPDRPDLERSRPDAVVRNPVRERPPAAERDGTDDAPSAVADADPPASSDEPTVVDDPSAGAESAPESESESVDTRSSTAEPGDAMAAAAAGLTIVVPRPDVVAVATGSEGRPPDARDLGGPDAVSSTGPTAVLDGTPAPATTVLAAASAPEDAAAVADVDVSSTGGVVPDRTGIADPVTTTGPHPTAAAASANPDPAPIPGDTAPDVPTAATAAASTAEAATAVVPGVGVDPITRPGSAGEADPMVVDIAGEPATEPRTDAPPVDPAGDPPMPDVDLTVSTPIREATPGSPPPESGTATTAVAAATVAAPSRGDTPGDPATDGSHRAAAVAAATPTRAPTETMPAGTVERIVPSRFATAVVPEAARLRTNGGTRTLEVRLDPPDLGTVDVEIRSDGTSVLVVARTESGAATQALLRQRPQIEANLEALGMSLTGFDVSSGDSNGRDERDPHPAGEAPRPASTAVGDEIPDPRSTSEGTIFL